MLPTTVIQIVTILADLVIFIFVCYYLWELRAKEKLIEKAQKETDENYHHVVDDALAKERKILEDAAFSSSQIIAGTKYVTSTSKESLDEAIQKMEGTLTRELGNTSADFNKNYSTSLQHLANQSLAEFQNVVKTMETDLQKQTRTFSETMIPQLEKELEEYKKLRLQQADRTITNVIQEVSQQILNKALPLEDHQQLLIEALERAKKEGVFS
ncbi:MAG TPA: hypothetical protein VLF93_01465 [Candidatus Saccharimonadales bacterium]|nr:hypothetical protein [Candidatus Saccharimonadales bacterium]